MNERASHKTMILEIVAIRGTLEIIIDNTEYKEALKGFCFKKMLSDIQENISIRPGDSYRVAAWFLSDERDERDEIKDTQMNYYCRFDIKLFKENYEDLEASSIRRIMKSNTLGIFSHIVTVKRNRNMLKSFLESELASL